MKIGSIENKVPVAPVAGERRTGGPSAQGAANPQPSATVELSAEAAALGAPQGDGSFDAAKVERISRAIAEGTFKPNPEAIADKLIANAQELLARTYR